MNEWEVFGVIVALIAFVTGIVTPIIKLNSTIVKLTAIVDEMAKDLESLTKRNADSHQRIFDKLDNHENRLTVLETKQNDDGR